MLAITEDAATAIDSIVASSGLPEGAGLRITQEVNPQSGEEARPDFRLSPAKSAEEGDVVLEDVRIFIEPGAADFLDNKLLDADVEGDKVHFSFGIKAEAQSEHLTE